MILSQEEYIDKIAKRAIATKKVVSRSLYQRRNQVTDINGLYFYAQGGGAYPAETRISISKDMVYLQRLEFKVIISPFMGTGGVSPEIIPVPVTASNFKVKIDGVDVSPYLAAQHNGWISGEGIWPSDDDDKRYDLLEAICDIWSERSDEQKLKDYKKLTKPGYKKFQITASSLFSSAFQMWCKFPNTNR